MRYRRFLTLATILSVSALTFAGCAHSPGRLAVDLQAALSECKKLERYPQVSQITQDTDFRQLSGESLGEIKKTREANARRDKCEADVIQKYRTAN